LHGNTYSSCWHQLMGITIARWLSSSMWDFLLFGISTQSPSSYSIPPIVLYPWLTLIYCVKVEKVWDYLSTKQLLGLSSGVYKMGAFLCDENEDMIALISMLEVLLFLMSIWTFILNNLDLNIHATIKKITLRIMLGSIPHQKFCFYHLPTWGRARIKLGDAWYVSNVSIVFIVPCNYITRFGCLWALLYTFISFLRLPY